MLKDIEGINRYVYGYDKIPDEDGDQLMKVKYKLKEIDLNFLRKMFNIDPNDPNPVNRDLIGCYDINEEQANTLQPYIIDGIIDLNKYDFMLHCTQAEGWNWSEGYPKKIER